MKLNEIVAIAGVGGLHQIIGKTKNGLILESLTDKKRFPTSTQDRVSVLDDIAMYTIEGDMRLAQVLVKINEAEKAGKTIPTGKDDIKIQRTFLVETIQLDSERVYDSDVKKLLNWYASLKSILDFATLLEEDASGASVSESEEVAEAKPKVKKAKADASDEEVKPKKTAAKKTTAKTVAPKNTAPKTNTKGTGNTNTYRPKSV